MVCRIDDLLAFLLWIGLETQCNYLCVILECVHHSCSLTTIAALISVSDNFVHRVVVHYYAKGDKCDVTGKHRDVHTSENEMSYHSCTTCSAQQLNCTCMCYLTLLCCDSSFGWLVHVFNRCVLPVH